MSRSSSPQVGTNGLQAIPADVPPTIAAAALAVKILKAELSVDESIGGVVAHLADHPRGVTVVAALTTFAPEDRAAWVHLGERAWLREWRSPGSLCHAVPDHDAGPEAALTMPWVSDHARREIVAIPDVSLLPDEARQDREELARCNAVSTLTSAQMLDGTMFGSVSVMSGTAGPWEEAQISDLRLLSGVLASRLALEQGKRSLADAIALADQARAAQQQFFATIGHELRTPIAAILGFAEVLGDDARDREEETGEFAATVAHDSGVIIRAAEQLLAIVEDLLSTGRTLGHDEARDALDVSAAVADVIHWHRTPATARRVSVTSTVAPGVTVHARASGLRQVLTNLIGNAVVYNRVGGSVEISTEASFGESREPRVRIMVRDTGPGLAADELSRAFEPFVRFAATDVKGTGLGLSLARAVAERDGGHVGAESTPGQGSVFWVDLPATAD